jgi:hypothetical protein
MATNDSMNGLALTKNINKNENIINNNEINQFVCKIYRVFNETEYAFVSTRQANVNKYLNKIKHVGIHKNKTLGLILSGNYNCEFVERFEYINKSQLIAKLLLINDYYKRANCKELDLKYGLKQENPVLCKIQSFFANDEIVKAKYKYSPFDFIGLKSSVLYELKTNRDKYGDYPTAIIGVDKVIEREDIKQIFLFQFATNTDEPDLYYFIKPPNFKTTYKQRQIYLRARDIYNDIYDIPRTELIKINRYETHNLDIISNTETISYFMHLDKTRADI